MTELERSLTGPGGPFEIAEVEIRGVTTRVWKTAPNSLRDIWDASRVHAARDFLVYDDERYTYARAHRVVATLARRLTEGSLTPFLMHLVQGNHLSEDEIQEIRELLDQARRKRK